jgi:hypothetical protein
MQQFYSTLYGLFNRTQMKITYKKFKHLEEGFVEQVVE